MALALIGAASAGFIAPLTTGYSSLWNADLALGYGYGAGYYGLGAAAYAAPALTTYAAPAYTTAYHAPVYTTGLTGYVAPSYGLDIWKKKKAA